MTKKLSSEATGETYFIQGKQLEYQVQLISILMIRRER